LKKTFTETYSDSVKKDTNSKDEEQTSKANLYEHITLLPIDWSLKTRLRFLSIHPFSCNNGIKSQQESEAILNFSKFNKFYENLNAANQVSSYFRLFFKFRPVPTKVIQPGSGYNPKHLTGLKFDW
jgi:hypothetical protein